MSNLQVSRLVSGEFAPLVFPQSSQPKSFHREVFPFKVEMRLCSMDPGCGLTPRCCYRLKAGVLWILVKVELFQRWLHVQIIVVQSHQIKAKQHLNLLFSNEQSIWCCLLSPSDFKSIRRYVQRATIVQLVVLPSALQNDPSSTS